ncbi:thiol-activated cytolysin family protein [Streptomyces sp. NPDC056480]|uniref:thiol-activated cytolysin family protein n=1 Tax=Streptomyces sp. NPDC056480 TaxID=3345833 RepID=UPI0036C2B07A
MADQESWAGQTAEGLESPAWLVQEDRAPAWLDQAADGSQFVDWHVDGADRYQLVRLLDGGPGRVVDEKADVASLTLPDVSRRTEDGEYAVVALSDGERVANSVLGVGERGGKVDLASYLATRWQPWTELAPQEPDEKKPMGDSTTDVVKGVKRVTRPWRMTTTPQDIFTSGKTAGTIWPGSIVQSQKIIKNGDMAFAQIETSERAPLRIAIDALGGGPSEPVQSPDYGLVLDAIKRMVAGKKNTSPTVVFKKAEAYSSTEAALSLGISAKYMTFSGSLNVEAKRKENQNTLVVYLYERAFIASAVFESPNALINDTFTEERLKRLINMKKLGPDNPPMIVSDVVYGRIVFFTMTSSATETEINAALSASYNAFANLSAEVTARYKSVIGESDIQVSAMGGNPTLIKSLLGDGKISDYFGEIHNMDEYSVIGYVLKTLEGEAATMSETTAYDAVAWGGGDEVMLTIDEYWRGEDKHGTFSVEIEGNRIESKGRTPAAAILDYPPSDPEGYTVADFRLPGERMDGWGSPNVSPESLGWFTGDRSTASGYVELPKGNRFHYKADLL